VVCDGKLIRFQSCVKEDNVRDDLQSYDNEFRTIGASTLTALLEQARSTNNTHNEVLCPKVRHILVYANSIAAVSKNPVHGHSTKFTWN